MKRSLEKDDYPDFTSLFEELNKRFYEKVIICIESSVWTVILNNVQRETPKIRYNHQWVQWTLVSKRFYQATYGLPHIFIDINQPRLSMGTVCLVLKRFTQLKRLTIPCGDTESIVLPLLPHLEKLKFRHSKKKHCTPEGSTCDCEPDLSLLKVENLPNLSTLSFRHSCLGSELYHLNPVIRKNITKIHLNYNGWLFMDIIQTFPHITIFKLLHEYVDISTDDDLSKIKEIYLKDRTINFPNITGSARKYLKKSIAHISYYSGELENGKPIGQWKAFDHKKNYLCNVPIEDVIKKNE